MRKSVKFLTSLPLNLAMVMVGGALLMGGCYKSSPDAAVDGKPMTEKADEKKASMRHSASSPQGNMASGSSVVTSVSPVSENRMKPSSRLQNKASSQKESASNAEARAQSKSARLDRRNAQNKTTADLSDAASATPSAERALTPAAASIPSKPLNKAPTATTKMAADERFKGMTPDEEELRTTNAYYTNYDDYKTDLFYLRKQTPIRTVVNGEFPVNLTFKALEDLVNAEIYDVIPEGTELIGALPKGAFRHEDMIVWQFHEIPQGKQIDLMYTLKAVAPGALSSCAWAKAEQHACVTTMSVPVSNLAISKKAMIQEQYLGKTVEYQITVRNTGDAVLENVRVMDKPDAHTKIIKADGATFDATQATWMIASLAPGKSQTFSVVVTNAKDVGEFCNVATADVGGVTDADGDGQLLESAKACASWKGLPALLLEVVDQPDALIAGQHTLYTIRVTNQGSANDYNIQISALFPEEISPLVGDGDTKVTIEGKKVNLGSYPQLAPGQVLQWNVDAEAVAVGQGIIRVQLTSELIKRRSKDGKDFIIEEETTQVY